MSSRPIISPYGYTPSLAWNATFVALFSTSFFVHLYQATRSRYWVIYPTLGLGALIELMGYAARVWSSKAARGLDGFLMQICLLIMAPVFFSAYCYVVLGTAINQLGERFSVLPSKLYFIIFILADIISLVLQAVGGGQAAASARTSRPTQRATDIMVAGIIFQLCAMGIFIACGLDFAYRVVRNRPYAFRLRQIAAADAKRREKAGLGMQEHAMHETVVEKPAGDGEVHNGRVADAPASGSASADEPGQVELDKGEMSPRDQRKWGLVLTSVLISASMILTRGVFRSVELSEGWTGHLVRTEIYQMVLDGIPMVIAVGIFNVLHPGLILGRKASWKGYY